MSSTIRTVFVLTGPFAGRSINLGSAPYRFENGRLAIVATPEEVALHARFLERNWEAYPEGHPKLEGNNGQRDIPPDAGPQTVQGDGQPNGEGAEAGKLTLDGAGSNDPAVGSGQAAHGDGSKAELNVKLLKAVRSLDPEDDTHWTKEGKPSIVAVTVAYGSTDVTRSDIDAVAPKYTRSRVVE